MHYAYANEVKFRTGVGISKFEISLRDSNGGENMATQKMNMDQYMKMMEEWFSKLPVLPKGATDVIVKIAPWMALLFGVLGVLGSVAATGLMAALSPVMVLGGGVGVATGGLVGAVLALVSSVLMVMAFPGLRDRKAVGWKWSFYSELVSVLSSVVALNLVGAAIGGLIGFYILFAIKNYYR